MDSISDETLALGILLRTDYSNEEAWQTFLSRLRDGEADFVSETSAVEDAKMDYDVPGDKRGNASVADKDEVALDDEDEDDDGEDEDEPPPQIISVIDATPTDRAIFTNISNVTALRLLNDVDIVPAPMPPQGTQRIKPANRLVDHDGWQEAYTGKTIWIYDAKSNLDQSARLVSQRGQAYGNAW